MDEKITDTTIVYQLSLTLSGSLSLISEPRAIAEMIMMWSSHCVLSRPWLLVLSLVLQLHAGASALPAPGAKFFRVTGRHTPYVESFGNAKILAIALTTS